MDNGQEIVAVVDEENRETGRITRAEMRARCLIHRATYILVFNSRHQLFVQKRTETKDIYPGFYEIAAGGVVLAGESYEDSALRELQEELGVVADDLNHLFDHFHDDGKNRVWGRVFSCFHDGPFRLQEEEVASGEFMDMEEVLAMIKEKPFCPDGVDILRRYLGTHPSW